MPLDLRTLAGRVFLCEPVALRLAVARVATYSTCFSAREVATARRELMDEARQTAARAVRGVKGKVAVIPCYGPLGQRMTSEIMKADGTTCEMISAALDSAMADPGVGAIVLDMDSPGGTSQGMQELSDKLFSLRGQGKAIYAAVNSMMCSAAYWVGSAAEHIACTPGGDTGSIGVYAVHADNSKALEAEGIAVTVVSAGKYKTEGSPFEPLSAEARDHFQSMVDDTYSKFTKGVARNRGRSVGDVKAGFGQGRVMTPEQALAAGAIDSIRSFDELLGQLTGGASSSGMRRASAEVLRLRHEHQKRTQSTPA